MMLSDRTGGTITLSAADGLMAGRARTALSHVETAELPEYLHFTELPDDVVIPKAAMPLIAQMLEAMSKGESIRLMAESREVTPQRAAAILGISRPVLVHLLDTAVIPFRYVGSHRRIKLSDVLAHQAERQRRHEVLAQLVAQAQELDMGY